jgi:hypothetical protein
MLRIIYTWHCQVAPWNHILPYLDWTFHRSSESYDEYRFVIGDSCVASESEVRFEVNGIWIPALIEIIIGFEDSKSELLVRFRVRLKAPAYSILPLIITLPNFISSTLRPGKWNPITTFRNSFVSVGYDSQAVIFGFILTQVFSRLSISSIITNRNSP